MMQSTQRGFHDYFKLPSLTERDNHTRETLTELNETIEAYQDLLHRRLRDMDAQPYIALWLRKSGIRDKAFCAYAMRALMPHQLLFLRVAELKARGNRVTTMWLKNNYGLYMVYGNTDNRPYWIDRAGRQVRSLHDYFDLRVLRATLHRHIRNEKTPEKECITKAFYQLLHVLAFDTMYGHVCDHKLTHWIYYRKS